ADEQGGGEEHRHHGHGRPHPAPPARAPELAGRRRFPLAGLDHGANHRAGTLCYVRGRDRTRPAIPRPIRRTGHTHSAPRSVLPALPMRNAAPIPTNRSPATIDPGFGSRRFTDDLRRLTDDLQLTDADVQMQPERPGRWVTVDDAVVHVQPVPDAPEQAHLADAAVAGGDHPRAGRHEYA